MLPAPKEILTNARTWGDFKRELSDVIRDLKNTTAVLKETRATLEMDDAILPDTNCTIFISQKQIKAGTIDTVRLLESAKDKFSELIDSLIEEVEDGEFDVDDNFNRVSKVAEPSISNEDAEFLQRMSR